MNTMFNPEEMKRIGEARESFSGLLLTDRQFDDVIAVTGILERCIKETGSFKAKLDHYSGALAGTESFDIAKANTITRDIFRIRTGVPMNEMRKALTDNEGKLFDRENNLAEAEKQKAYMAANAIGKMVEEGTKMSFNRAYAYATTIHKSQGATVDHAFVLKSRTMDQHLSYVAMTRHKEQMRVYEQSQNKDKHSSVIQQDHDHEFKLEFDQ